MRTPHFSPVLAGITGLLLLGCQGLRTAAQPDVPTWKNQAGSVFQLQFRRDLAADSRRDGETYERGQPELDIRGRRVFVGSSDRGLYALDAASGRTLWRFEALSFIQAQPLYAADEDAVYFGGHDGGLYKLSASDGKLLWRFGTNAEVSRQPIIIGDRIYFSNGNDTLLALERNSGRPVWNYHRPPALGMEVAGHSGPTVREGLIYMGFSDGTALAFDLNTGEERWAPVDLSSEAEDAIGEPPKYLDVDTTPVTAELGIGPAVIFGHYVGGVSALDAEMGTLLWANTDATGVTDVTLFEQKAYQTADGENPARQLVIVSTGTSGLWALDPETGDVVWRRDLPAGGVTRPVVASGLLLVGASQLGLYALSPIDGSLVDGIHFDLGVSAAPAAFGRRAFVMTNGGNFYGFSLETPGSEDPLTLPRYGGSTTIN